MSEDWKRGDMAVCVDAKPDSGDPLADLLTEKKVYRVRTADFRADGVFALAFLEIRCPDNPKQGYGFSAWRFRKLKKATKKFTTEIRSCKPHRERQPA